MNLTPAQISKVFQVWNFYIENGENILHGKNEFSSQELDQKRRELIPEISSLITIFISGELALESFRSKIDSINKKNRFWGFMAINGQMFFNMLIKSSQTGNMTPQLVSLLKEVLLVPSSIGEAKSKIEMLQQFVRDLAQFSGDARGAPKVGSIPYFISYFWQIQKPDLFPIYYTSMVKALQSQDIWSPSKNVIDDYISFYELSLLMLEKLRSKNGNQLTLWDVEHAFWVQYLLLDQNKEPSPKPQQKETPVVQTAIEELPVSFIPPVVSILPKLAVNDPGLIRVCQQSGKPIEKVFEERIAILFGMLGFETELLGQGRGRVPDGVAVSDEFRYAIIYDAKIREQGYNMGTDERAIKEYINSQAPKLRHRGINTIYFSIISDHFIGNNLRQIPGIKIETGINEVILIEIKSLMVMLEAKLKNPSINLGQFGLQRLFASSGILSDAHVREFLET